MTDEGPAPPPDALPAELWRRVERFADHEVGDPGALAADLLAWCDGRPADDLEALLDALRERGAYPISLEVLEAAWNSDLPAARLGRVAEDWVGTVLLGLGDRAGAREVAAHLCAGATKHGVQFAGDLGHVLLGWDMPDLAAPLIEAAAKALPGDVALRYDLGVVQKLRGDFAASADSFRAVLRHRDEPAARWNLGIAAVALHDWATAREMWTKLDLMPPPGDGDYASPGELTPVRVPAGEGAPVEAELLWGDRLGPARVLLRSIPRFPGMAGYGDIVLVDGVAVGETGRDGEAVPVVPALKRWRTAGHRQIALCGPEVGPVARQAIARLAERLQADGWPAADHSGLDGTPALRLALVIERGRNPAALLESLRALRGPLPLDETPLRALVDEAK